MSLLEIENLKMYYETLRGWVRAVDDVDIVIEKRDSLGLAGESGCGKTSTMLSILRLLPYNARIFGGRIKFGGKNIVKMPEKTFRRQVRWKRISTIFQGAMNALHPTMDVGSQISESILAHEKINKAATNHREPTVKPLKSPRYWVRKSPMDIG